MEFIVGTSYAHCTYNCLGTSWTRYWIHIANWTNATVSIVNRCCSNKSWFSIGSTIGSCCWGIIIRTDYLSMINKSPMKTNCAMSLMWMNPSLLKSIRLFARRIFVWFYTNLNRKKWFILLILEKWNSLKWVASVQTVNLSYFEAIHLHIQYYVSKSCLWV